MSYGTVHKTFPEQWRFGRQEKDGAFSVSMSQLDTIIHYIKDQREHHRTKTFQEEFRPLLDRHGIRYDERHLWE